MIYFPFAVNLLFGSPTVSNITRRFLRKGGAATVVVVRTGDVLSSFSIKQRANLTAAAAATHSPA